MMRRWILVFLLPAAGCALLDPPDSLEREAASLSSPEIEAAIKDARPGEPRRRERTGNPASSLGSPS